jgi:hypothetical protein
MFYDWPAIIGDCRNAIVQDTPHVIAPVSEAVGTKKNKVRMDKKDKDSPLGLVMKEMDNYQPYAAAKFDPEEVVKWAVQRFLDLSEEDQRQFVVGMNDQLGTP